MQKVKINYSWTENAIVQGEVVPLFFNCRSEGTTVFQLVDNCRIAIRYLGAIEQPDEEEGWMSLNEEQQHHIEAHMIRELNRQKSPGIQELRQS